MLREFVHYLGLAVAVLAALAFAGLRLAAGQYFDPDGALDERLTKSVFPAARASDFRPPGWLLIKLSWVAVLAAVIGAFMWAITAPGT